MARIVPSMKTSNTDTAESRRACSEAAKDLSGFRRKGPIRRNIDCASEIQGREYFLMARARWPSMGQFGLLDSLGNPDLYEYGRWYFSPSTMRYAGTLADIIDFFGKLKGLDVVEIGGGYGGQCAAASIFGGYRSWTLIDLPEVLEMAKAYLGVLGIKAIYKTKPPGGQWDLAISNYAISECEAATHEAYRRNVLLKSARGYVTYNRIEGRDKLLHSIPNAELRPEPVHTDNKNSLIVWGF